MSPIIRSWDAYKPNLLRCLETVKSILVPNINSADQTLEIVKAVNIILLDLEGLSPYTRCHNYSDNGLENKLKKANDDILIGILVEGKDGLENLEEISSIEGLDLIYLGLFDICQSLGLPGQLEHPEVLNKLSEYKRNNYKKW